MEAMGVVGATEVAAATAVTVVMEAALEELIATVAIEAITAMKLVPNSLLVLILIGEKFQKKMGRNKESILQSQLILRNKGKKKSRIVVTMLKYREKNGV